MSDIFNDLSNYDQSFPMPVKGNGGVDTGVVFHVRDIKNTESQVKFKAERNRLSGIRINGGDVDDELLGALINSALEDPTDEMLAFCVTGWDWGEHTLGDCDLKFTVKNVLSVFKKAPAIREQVRQMCVNIDAFIEA